MNGLTIRRYGFIGLLVGAMLGGVVLLAMTAGAESADPREVRLVVRDMTFFVANDETPNPTLRFRAGETVRVVLRNEDAGMQHDFIIKNWKVGSALLDGKGETVFEFQVPEKRGPESYSCTPHAVMMRGTIEVE
jgi:plastocyanin